MARPIGQGNGFIDITGQKFGKLTVLERDFKRQEERKKAGVVRHKTVYWLSRCDCGNIVSSRGHQLRNGTTKSCGCIKKEVAKRIAPKRRGKNTWETNKNITYGYDQKENKFIIDTEDLDLVKQYYWAMDNNGYICSNLKIEDNRKELKLHRIVLGVDEREQFVDHINGSPSDNRKDNLRVCTNQQNCCNQGLSKDNTSGFTGVSLHKNTGLWHAYIGYNGLRSLGYYKTFKEAVTVRHEAEKKYHGEFSGELNRRKDYKKIIKNKERSD